MVWILGDLNGAGCLKQTLSHVYNNPLSKKKKSKIKPYVHVFK